MRTTLDDFFFAVEQMRERQKIYFKTRVPSALYAAKKSEAAVDDFIKKRHEEQSNKLQPNLL
jgi:hypothetical protein